MSKFREFITYRSLHQKYSVGNSLETLDSLIQAGGLFRIDENGKQIQITTLEEAHPNFIKNLCAKVPAILVDQLDQLCGKLAISKREFIENALWEALSEAQAIHEELGVDEYIANYYGEVDSKLDEESEVSA